MKALPSPVAYALLRPGPCLLSLGICIFLVGITLPYVPPGAAWLWALSGGVGVGFFGLVWVSWVKRSMPWQIIPAMFLVLGGHVGGYNNDPAWPSWLLMPQFLGIAVGTALLLLFLFRRRVAASLPPPSEFVDGR